MRVKIFLFTSLILIWHIPIAEAQIIISEVDPNGRSVEFENISDTSVYLGDFTFRSSNRVFFDLPVTLEPGENASFLWIYFENNFGQYSIHNLDQFNAENYIDYVIWSDTDTVTQEMLYAVEAGVWDGLDKYAPIIPDEENITLSHLNFAAESGHHTNSTTWGITQKSTHEDAICDDQSFEPNERVLSSVVTGLYDYEAETLIRSDQHISAQSKVDYDSSIEVLLEEGFEIEQGAIFEAFINGCNYGEGGIN